MRPPEQLNARRDTAVNAFYKFLQDASEIPTSTLSVIAVMCGIAMYFVRTHLVIPGMIVILYPLVVVLSVVANYGFVQLEYFSLNRYDQWMMCTVSSATLGVIGGLVIAASLARVMEFFQTRKQIKRA